MITRFLHENWQMRKVGEDAFMKAVVPGSVYTDLLRAGKMEDPFFKDNEQTALRLMDDDYEYITRFDVEEKNLSSRLIFLHFDGLDTICDIYLNDKHLGYADNMHRIWEYSVKEYLKAKGNELRVVFHSPNQYIAEQFANSPTYGSADCMNGFVHIRKTHSSFGWDWGAHLPDAGIVHPVSLLFVEEARIDNVLITQEHQKTAVSLNISVETADVPSEEIKAQLTYSVEIKTPSGTLLLDTDSPKKIEIENPELWWPNGFGEQALYTVTVTLMLGNKELDSWTRRIGLRTMTMHREKDEWGECFNLCVNGVDIFAMGADYIPQDHLLGRVNAETTRTLLEKAKWANFNSIRVWGGGYYPEDFFYDTCDELGLVVWQDCMFACAMYDLTPAFEANIRAELKDNVRRIRHHASLGLWCGNNEMEEFASAHNVWVTKPQEIRDYFLMYERVIPEVIRENDPVTFYWPSSPSSGGSFDEPQDPNRGDVHYWDVWHGNKPFTEYRKFFFRYLSEFGFQSFPTMKTIEAISDDPADHNIFSYIMERHQRNGAANGKIMNYMQATYRYPSDFKTVLYASQLLQADAIRYGVEHFRRNRKRCMGAIYWQFNDCWPVASWSSVDYFGRFKALHYYAKRFFEPVMISCEEHGLMDSGHQLNQLPFDFEKSIRLNVTNETMLDVKGTVRWTLRNPKAEIITGDEIEVTIPALSSLWLDKVEFPDVDIYSQYVSYEFIQNGKVVSSGSVNFSYPKYFKYENPNLSYKINGDELTVSASCYAKSIEILNENEDLILSDNYFDLNGGSKTVKIESGDVSTGLRLRSVYDIR